jgi:hypothetical protein
MPIWIFVKETMTIATNPSQLNSYPNSYQCCAIFKIFKK